MEERSVYSVLECKCDEACLFLGDCCYDYLMECSPQQMDLSTGLQQQLDIYDRFADFSHCVYHTVQVGGTKPFRLVDSCPDTADNKTSVQCSTKQTLSSYVLVESQGVLFANMFCAACHRLLFHQLTPVVSHGFVCKTGDLVKVEKHLLPFVSNMDCSEHILKVKPAFNYLQRYMDVCSCSEYLSYRKCEDERYQRECHAYSNVVLDVASGRPYHNEACRECDDNGSIMLDDPSWCDHSGSRNTPNVPFVKLFDFTSITSDPEPAECREFYDKGESGNPCLVMRCQEGFEVHDNRCMSMATVAACYPHDQNSYYPESRIANLFQSAMILQYRKIPRGDMGTPVDANDEILNSGIPCHHVPYLHYIDWPQDVRPGMRCVVIKFDPFAFGKLASELTVKDITAKLFPTIDVYHTALLNHDPVEGVTCSKGVRLEPMAHLEVAKGGIVTVRSQETRRRFISNKHHLIVSRKTNESNLEIWAVFCRNDVDNSNCSEKMEQDALQPINVCLKYMLTDKNTTIGNTRLLMSGERLKPGEFLVSSSGDILLCVDLYNQLHGPKSNASKLFIVVSVVYTVSLCCLMATFVIYVRYRALRTLPGLMLMNLILALFFAQLLFLLDTLGTFHSEPVFCQVMASAQHYFWLASFAWMACMSLDIFHCLSCMNTAVNTYTHSKYAKYVITGWLLPLLIPLITNVLTSTSSSTLGYKTSGSCWLADSHSVLYLFAIPVFTIVCANMILFIGSVCRLCTLLKNATYVGRKEDNKQRLVQCVKLSSWMGISWLFGIVPNYVNVEALWLVFVAANAMQGIHIFVSFGITGKARVLMHRDSRAHTDTTPRDLSAIPTVMANLSVD